MSYPHKTHNRLISYFGLVTIAVFGIITTLGSGGGDDGGGVAPVTYTGETALAVITSDNALLFGELAFLGVTAGTDISAVAVQSAPQDETRSASIITIARILHSVMTDIDVNSALSSLPVGWIETINEPGLCGGSVSGSEEVDEVTMTFTGNLVFSGYCIFDIYLNGTIEISGTCDPTTFDPTFQYCEPISYTMTFTTFNTRGYGESETITGTLASVITPTGYQSTLNLLLRDDNANKTYQFENYVITVTEDSPTIGFDTVVVTGNVYHPDYGFVVVTTPTPVEFYSGALDSPPLTGVVLLTGANGTVGPTTATFTFIDATSFTAAVDEDGDTVTDVTWSCDWDGNCSII